MTKIVVEMTGEEAKLHQAMMAAVADHSKLEQSVDKVAMKSKKLAREEAAVAREAKRIYEETRTPQEQYNARMARLNKLLHAGRIGHETARRAARNYSDQLRRAGKHGQAAFGSQAVQALSLFAAKLLAVAGGGAAVIQMFRKMREMKEQAAAESRSSAMSFGELSQLAIKETPEGLQADPARAAQLRATARRIFAQGGAASQEQANAMTFSLASAGMDNEADFFAKLYAQGLVREPGEMVQSQAAMKAAFGEQAGSARDVFNKAIVASRITPAKAEEILQNTAATAKYAPAIGISDVEAMAAVAAVATPMKGANQAGTAITRLFASLGKIGAGGVGTVEGEDGVEVEQKDAGDLKAKIAGRIDFEGKSLMEQLHQIEGLGLNEAELQKLLGRQQAVAGYRFLLAREKEFGDVKRQIKSLRGDLAGDLMGLVDQDPSVRAALTAKKEEAAGKAAAEETIAIEENVIKSVREHTYKALRKGKKDPAAGAEATIAIAEMGDTLFGWIPGARKSDAKNRIREGFLDDDPKLKAWAMRELGMRQEFAPQRSNASTIDLSGSHNVKEDFFTALEQSSKQLSDASGKLDQAADNLNRSNKPRPTLAAPDQKD